MTSRACGAQMGIPSIMHVNRSHKYPDQAAGQALKD